MAGGGFGKRYVRMRFLPSWVRAGAVPVVAESDGGHEVLYELLREDGMRFLATQTLVNSSASTERIVQELRRAVHGEAPAQYVPPTPREVVELDLWIAVDRLPVRELLLEALEDPEPRIRARAATLLADHGRRGDIAAVRRLADEDPEEEVRAAAASASRRIEQRP